TIVYIVPGYNSAIINFTQASANTYSYVPPTGYSYSVNGGADILVDNVSTFYTNSFTITGLSPSTTYTNVKFKFKNLPTAIVVASFGDGGSRPLSRSRRG
ncbi:MAG: hypothetical protein WCH37_09210, partial [Synechococcaceae cyanobacterium ELA182]